MEELLRHGRRTASHIGLPAVPGVSSTQGGIGRPPDSDLTAEHGVTLELSTGEVGCGLGQDGAVPPEACAASSADYVRLHSDEFLEAWSHSTLGRWSPEWLGFRSARPWGAAKRIRAKCVHHPLERPRAMCIRLNEPIDARSADLLVAAFLRDGTPGGDSKLLLVSLTAQLADLISDLTCGALVQFAGATLWLMGESRSPRMGSLLGVVKLSHFAEMSMRRIESCDQHCLEALHEVQAAVRRAMRRRQKTHQAASPVTHACSRSM